MRQRFNLPPRWGCDVDEYQTQRLRAGLCSRAASRLLRRAAATSGDCTGGAAPHAGRQFFFALMHFFTDLSQSRGTHRFARLRKHLFLFFFRLMLDQIL